MELTILKLHILIGSQATEIELKGYQDQKNIKCSSQEKEDTGDIGN